MISTKRIQSLIIAGALAAGLSPMTTGVWASTGVTVVELFTSQGCSSCPPADALLGDLAQRDGIIALSLPVDYWDYLGWKDSLASPMHTERQRAYAKARGDRAVYTPQIVINGREHVIGSRIGEVISLVEAAAEDALPVEVELTESGSSLTVSISETEVPDGEIIVWMAGYTAEERIDIKRGENAGRQIAYYNVVRKLKPIGQWDGSAMTIDVPVAEWADKTLSGCVVIVQRADKGGAGAILGAAKITGL